MFRGRRFAKPVLVLIAAGAVVLAASGCAFVKPGSLTVAQPQGIGSVRVHFDLCTVGGSELCGPNEDDGTLQYVLGIAVPPGSVAPTTLTAVPTKGGAPIVFTRNEEVVPQLTASSAAQQKLLTEVETPKEAEEAEEFKQLLGGLWPPSGLQGVGYLSAPSQEVKGASAEWSLDADFGLPVAADGAPFPGPFSAAIAHGFREVSVGQPASRPVSCLKLEAEAKPQEGDAFCSGSVQQAQFGTADLQISAPAKPAQAFVGGSAQLAFPLRFAGSTATVPSFALSATTTLKGGKAKPTPVSYAPGAPDPATRQAPTASGKVTVSVPRGAKPGIYEVTLLAAAPQGGTVTEVAKLKLTRPKLTFGAVRLDPVKGTAKLRVKVPSGGRLTIAGKGVARVKKKAKRAKMLTVEIAPTGAARSLLDNAGSVRLKVKARFKPSSGIAVSKKKSVLLQMR